MMRCITGTRSTSVPEVVSWFMIRLRPRGCDAAAGGDRWRDSSSRAGSVVDADQILLFRSCRKCRGISFALSLLALLTACGDSGPGPEIHDTKYRAVGTSGALLPTSNAPGICTLDEFTGLSWEVKTDSGGLRDARHTYTWYDPEEAHGGDLDYRGTPGGGECSGSACDTAAYVAAVNATALCGFTDWRMPTRDELGSISDPRRTGSPPTINLRHFPLTQSGEYWSGNDYQFQHDAAWVWSFQTGMDRVEWKRSPRYLRLVRGEARRVPRVED